MNTPPAKPSSGLNMPAFSSATDVVRHEIQSILPMIQDVSFQAPRITYPETRFRSYFAPFFLGVYEVPANENIQMLWVSEVGSLNSDVDIVDPNGVTLFVVPALMNLEGINLKATGASRIRFASINQKYDENSRNFPEKSRLEYFQDIGNKLGTAFQNIQTDPGHTRKWLRIFEYYNVTPPSSEQYKIVPNANYQAPSASGSAAFPTNQDWSNLGRLDFTPTFD